MKDAFGGILNIVFVAVFLVVVSGILGFIVSYTKAFKMKDSVISTIENFEGSGCYPSTSSGSGNIVTGTACANEVLNSAKRLAYSPSSLKKCPTGFYAISGDGGILACVMMDKKTKSIGKRDNVSVATFTVITQVDIDFPIVDKIMGMRVFQVSGDTRTVELQS